MIKNLSIYNSLQKQKVFNVKNWNNIIFIFLFFVYTLKTYTQENSQPYIEISNPNKKTNVTENFYFLKEKGNADFNLERLKNADFKKPKKLYYYFPEPVNNETIWLRYKLNNRTNQNVTYYHTLRNAYSFLSTIYTNNDNTIDKLHDYSYQNIDKNNVYLNYPTWKINIPKQKKITVYLKIHERGGRVRISSLLKSKKDFFKYSFWTITSHAVFFIFITICILFCFYIAHLFKTNFIYFFAFYIFFVFVDYICIKGIGQSYLWTNQDFIIKNIRSISNAFSAFFISLFLGSFYGYYKSIYWVKKTFYISAILFGVFLSLYLIKFFLGGLTSLFLYVWKAISVLTIIIIAIHSFLTYKKIIPLYLLFAFIIHTSTVFINSNFIFPFTTNPFLDWIILNNYHITLCIEIITWIYFALKVFQKEKQRMLKLENEFQHLQEQFNNLQLKKETQEKLITLKSKVVINCQKILYLKSDGHYIEYHMKDRNKPEIDRTSLNKALENLPTSSFVRIHRSFAVNINHIKIINSTKVMLSNNEWINLSRTYKNDLKEILGK